MCMKNKKNITESGDRQQFNGSTHALIGICICVLQLCPCVTPERTCFQPIKFEFVSYEPIYGPVHLSELSLT